MKSLTLVLVAVAVAAAPAAAQQPTPVRGWDGAQAFDVGDLSTLSLRVVLVGNLAATTVTANQGTPNSLANAWSVKVTDGTDLVNVTAAGAVQVDGSGVTQPISAASLPLPSGASTLGEQQTQTTALQLIDNLPVTQGSTTSGQSGVLVQGAVSTGAPSYTNGQTSPLSIQTDGSQRVAVTNTHTVTANAGSGTFTVSGTVTANAGTNLNTSALALDATLTNRLPSGSTPADNESNAITTSRLGAFNYVFDGSTWDRWTGTVTSNAGTGTFTVGGTVTSNAGTGNFNVIGPAADGAAVSGNPVRIAGKDGSGNTQDVATDTSGELQVDVLTLPSVTVGTFPDNEPFNLNQLAGNTVSSGNGAAGTGTLRVSVASDSTGNIATIGTSVTPGTGAANLGKAEDASVGSGDTGVAVLVQREDTPTSTASANNEYISPKANSFGHIFVADICEDPTLTTSVAISQTALNGNAELVALTASQTIYVCSFSMVVSAAASVRLVYGTGTACATGETGLTGAYPFAANGGIALGGGAILMKTAVSNALCIETSAAVNVHGHVTYAKF